MRGLVEADHEVALVITRPDRRRSRRGAPEASPVKVAAESLGLRVAHHVDDVLDTGADLGVVVAFGELIRPHVLERLPIVNLHFSLLPRWRGAAPVERAILAGDDETGVCLMHLDEGLDTGPVHGCVATRIGAEETAAELRRRLVELGTELLLSSLRYGLGTPRPQEGEPSYAPRLSPEDLRLDWSEPAEVLSRVLRIGRAWTTFRGDRLLVVEGRAVECNLSPGTIDGVVVGAGAGSGLALVRVQPEGRAILDALDWARGARVEAGEWLE